MFVGDVRGFVELDAFPVAHREANLDASQTVEALRGGLESGHGAATEGDHEPGPWASVAARRQLRADGRAGGRELLARVVTERGDRGNTCDCDQGDEQRVLDE